MSACRPPSAAFVLPKITAPAARSRATASASAAGTWLASPAAPEVLARPAVSKLSLIVMGTPCSGPSVRPRASARSAAAAATRALLVQRHDRVDRPVELRDAHQARFERLERAQLPRRDRRAQPTRRGQRIISAPAAGAVVQVLPISHRHRISRAPASWRRGPDALAQAPRTSGAAASSSPRMRTPAAGPCSQRPSSCRPRDRQAPAPQQRHARVVWGVPARSAHEVRLVELQALLLRA